MKLTKARIMLFLGLLVLASTVAFAASISFLGLDTKARLIDNNTTAVVTGSIVCELNDTLSITVILQQSHAGTSVIAVGGVSGLTCTGTPLGLAVPVPIVFPTANGTFKKGPVSALVTADVTDTSMPPGTASQIVTAKLDLSE